VEVIAAEGSNRSCGCGVTSKSTSTIAAAAEFHGVNSCNSQDRDCLIKGLDMFVGSVYALTIGLPKRASPHIVTWLPPLERSRVRSVKRYRNVGQKGLVNS
jgi:hypothetical protein